MNQDPQQPEPALPLVSQERSFSLGIDYGTYAFRYVLTDTHSGRIEEWGSYELDVEPAQKGKGARELGTFLAFLKDLARRIPKQRLERITVKMPGHSVVTGIVDIPAVEKKDQARLIELAVAKHLEYPLEQATFCWAAIKPEEAASRSGAPGGRAFFSFAASPKSAAMRLVEAVQEAFDPVPDISIQGYACEGLVRLLGLSERGEAVALIDVGKSATIISVYQNGRFVFERNIPIGSQDLTRAIMIMYLESRSPRAARDLAHAEELKKKSFIPTEGLTEAAPPLARGRGEEEGRLSPEENLRLFKAMEGILTALLHDIRLSFNFYSESAGGKKIEKVYLMGGGSELKYFSQFLSSRLDLETSFLRMEKDLIQFTPVSESEHFEREFHRYATAFAMSIKPPEYANLTPREFRTVPLERFGGSVIRILIITLAAVFLGWFLYLAKQETELERNINLLMEYKLPLKQIERPYLEMLQWQKFLGEADAAVPMVSEILKTLSRKTPSNIVFSSLAVERPEGQVVMEGLIYGDVKGRAVTITEYSKLLLGTGIFQNIEMRSLGGRDDLEGRGHFEMVAHLIKRERTEGQ